MLQGGGFEKKYNEESEEEEEEGDEESALTSSSLPSTEVLGSDAGTVETAAAAAAAGAGGLPDVDALREDDGRLWKAAADVLALMETQGRPARQPSSIGPLGCSVPMCAHSPHTQLLAASTAVHGCRRRPGCDSFCLPALIRGAGHPQLAPGSLLCSQGLC